MKPGSNDELCIFNMVYVRLLIQLPKEIDND